MDIKTEPEYISVKYVIFKYFIQQTGFSSGVEQLTVVVEYFNSLVSMGRWFDSSKPDNNLL